MIEISFVCPPQKEVYKAINLLLQFQKGLPIVKRFQKG